MEVLSDISRKDLKTVSCTECGRRLIRDADTSYRLLNITHDSNFPDVKCGVCANQPLPFSPGAHLSNTHDVNFFFTRYMKPEMYGEKILMEEWQREEASQRLGELMEFDPDGRKRRIRKQVAAAVAILATKLGFPGVTIGLKGSRRA